MEFLSSKFSAGNGCFIYEDNDVLIIVVFDDFWGVGLSRLFVDFVDYFDFEPIFLIFLMFLIRPHLRFSVGFLLILLI